ncbi:MAG: shikimate dehydrogenase [Candidatus Dormibacteria bacterium]
MRRYCLVGAGIAASPSPPMQEAAFRACDIEASYEVREATHDQLPAVMTLLRDGTFDGCNVTIPHKMPMAGLCDRLEGDAATLRAVNTLVRDGASVVGLNTDAAGFELALSALALWPHPRCNALVFGSGGAAAAVTLALTRAPAARVSVVARNHENALAMLERAAASCDTQVLSWSTADVRGALANTDIVVNATPAGMSELPIDLAALRSSCTVADVRYRPRPVDLVVAAAESRRCTCDGSEMLLCQGMLSFQAWTGVDPPWDVAREALHRSLKA